MGTAERVRRPAGKFYDRVLTLLLRELAEKFKDNAAHLPVEARVRYDLASASSARSAAGAEISISFAK